MGGLDEEMGEGGGGLKDLDDDGTLLPDGCENPPSQAVLLSWLEESFSAACNLFRPPVSMPKCIPHFCSKMAAAKYDFECANSIRSQDDEEEAEAHDWPQ
jgi:hypothetical protein